MSSSSVRFCQRLKACGAGYGYMFSLLLVSVFPVNSWGEAAFGETRSGVDHSGFSATADENPFSPGLNFRSRSILERGRDIQSSLEIRIISDITTDPDRAAAPDNPVTNYWPRGQIRRLSTSWNSGIGSLTVGSDWANFQDLLSMDKSPDGVSGQGGRSIASQIKWVSPNGFSIALEDASQTSLYSTGGEPPGNLFASSPSIILSWRGGGADDVGGEYRVTAMSGRLDADASGQKFDGSNITNWGLNLEGGWQIGDLFSALSVTFGKGINSYLLQKFDNDILVTPNEAAADGYDPVGMSFGIRPSLYYSLNDHSTFHVALGRYSTTEEDSGEADIDTLDTIHIGYSWSPWPSTRFGLQLRDQSKQGSRGGSEDTQLKFEAARQF